MTEFIMENNVWLIIFGILIFMAMIGYSVEKKRESKKDDKGDSKKQKDNEIKIETTSDIPVVDPIEPTSVPTIMVEGNPMETSMGEVDEIPTNPIGLDDLAVDSPNVDIDGEIPSTITETGEDLSVPLVNEIPVEENKVQEENAPMDLSLDLEVAPEIPTVSTEEVIPEVTPSIENMPVSNSQSEQDTTAADLGMDDISYLFTETKKEEENPTEDVWKF